MHSVAGTSAYLAPEAALGRSEIDGRADLYALGCVAFRLLTGRHVFEEDAPVAMIVAHTKEEPLPPSRYSEQDIPPGLDALVLACLAKEPADRPRTAEDLALGLEAIEGMGGWTKEKAAAWWRTHRPEVGAKWE